MPFSYYSRLNRRQKAIYRASDKIVEVALSDPATARKLADAVREALETDSHATAQRAAVSRATSRLTQELCQQLAVDPVQVRVLARRPRYAEAELHGLYTWEEGQRAQITVWMRTAAKRQVVAYRTFLRTLLHEVIHHLDYHQLKLDDSFHTQGFFKRESSLARQLITDRKAEPKARPRSKLAKSKPEKSKTTKKQPTKKSPPRAPKSLSKAEQLKLPFE